MPPKKAASSDSSTPPNASWNQEQVRSLLSFLKALPAKEVADNGFKKSGWNQVFARLNERHASSYTVVQIKSKYQVLKKEYDIYQRMRDCSGFGWDEEGQRVTAPDDVWEEYIKNSRDGKKIKQFRNKPFAFYEVMHDLCAGLSATGEFAALPGEEDLPAHDGSDNDEPLDWAESPAPDASLHSNGPDHESDSDSTPTPRATFKRRRASPDPASFTKRGKAKASGFALAEALTNLTDKIAELEERKSEIQNAVTGFQDFYEERLEMREMLAGVRILRNLEQAEIYLALRGNVRDIWIRNEIHNSFGLVQADAGDSQLEKPNPPQAVASPQPKSSSVLVHRFNEKISEPGTTTTPALTQHAVPSYPELDNGSHVKLLSLPPIQMTGIHDFGGVLPEERDTSAPSYSQMLLPSMEVPDFGTDGYDFCD